MEENDVLKRMHPLQLMLADELKRICEKYHITYFMIAGTLLGAVRHGGFIPWDDDMDFGILRKDYDKFLVVCDWEINTHIYYLQTEQKEKYYPFDFAKLSLKGTDFQEEYINRYDVHEGIYIDIFPIDTVPDNALKKWLQYKAFHVTDRLIKLKTGFIRLGKRRRLRHYIGRIISRPLPIKLLKMIRYKAISRYSGDKSNYVVTSDGAYGIEKETLKREWVEHIKNYSFEDRLYPGIADYNDYLTYFYGDYMTPPPMNDRNHHYRIKVSFGRYT